MLQRLLPVRTPGNFKQYTPAAGRVPLVLFVLLMLAPLLLAACGSDSASTAGPVTLTYGWWSNDPQKDNSMRAWLDTFQQSHPNIKIKSEILPWGNYWDKVKTTTAGGNAYDIIGLCSCAAVPYFDSGVLVDLKQFSDFGGSVKNLQAGPMQLYGWSGKQFGVPVGTAVPMLGYNKTLLKAAGVPLPDPTTPMTFEQFKEVAKKLTKVENGKAVQYALHPSNLLDWDSFIYMEGGQPYDNPVNPTKVTYNTPEGIQGLTDYLSLFKENIAPPYDQLGNGPWGSGDLPSLQTGKIAFARIGPWNFQEIVSQSPNIAVAPIFSIKQRAVVSTANGLGIYKGSKHPQEAWEFLKWATQTQGQVAFAKFSDVPSDKGALDQLSTIVKPADFVPTLLSDLQYFKPTVMTNKQQLSTAFGDIIADMVHGKLTPAQAAAKMDQQGNQILSGS